MPISPRTSQFSLGLSTADAYAACGPAAAIAFAMTYGRNPTVGEAMQIAKNVGWTNQSGMAGPGSEVNLLNQLGVPTHMTNGVDWGMVAREVQTGNPVIIDTPDHYFYVDNYDGNSGKFHFGSSSADLLGANHGEWFLPGDLPRIGGKLNTNPRSAIFADNPTQGGPSAVAGNPNVSVPARNVGGSTSLDYNDKAAVTNYIRQAAIARGIDPDTAVAVANSEGLNTYVGDNNSSFGPFQLHYGNVAQGGNAVSGLGDSFTKQTGLDARNPNTLSAQIDFSLDRAATNGWGDWHGAARLGIPNNQGIGPNSKALGITSPAGTNVGGPQSTGPTRPAGIPDWVPQDMWNMYSTNPYRGTTSPNIPPPQIPSLSNASPFGSFSGLPGGNQGFQTLPFTGPPFNWQDAMSQWNVSERQAFNQSPWAGMTPMTDNTQFSPYNAPFAQPNLMSRMSNPGSLYG